MPNNSWLEFVKEFREKNPGYSYKDALKRCKELKKGIEYLEQQGFKNVKLVDKTKKEKLRDSKLTVNVPST